MRKAILCVDDEKIVLDSLCAQFERSFGSEFIYEAAESVEEAWEVIDELIEDGCTLILVISDWLMPDVKGDEFLREVHQKWPKTIKIILTGYADNAALEKAKETANLYCIIQKPWDGHELIEQIKRALVTVQ
ncbi:response regulator [Wukongibacter baidiensis]|uniref:response regulator n=1 Tax=Wukongibacter baidiensis TaxID=1723361 RepID=UPI003D7F2775